MNFDLISDLHISSFSEESFKRLQPTSNILVVLGDVCEVGRVNAILPFFEMLSDNWYYVIYVPGNHEFYFSNIQTTVSRIKNNLDYLSNIIVLDNDVISIDGIRYIGSTLWSDMDKNNPIVKMNCKKYINDYRYIFKDIDQILEPDNTIELFNRNISFIDDMLCLSDPDEVNVILTHHAPSFKSVSARFIGDVCNGAFVSSLEDIILDNPSIRVWAHGHTHNYTDYKIGYCRVVANPYGYSREVFKNEDDYKPIRIEVEK